MSFCAKCGRQRTGSRFCSGCGHDFGEQTSDSGTALGAQPVTEPPAAWTPAPDPAPDPAARNPFALRAGQAPGYPPRAPAGNAFAPPPAPADPGRGSGGGRRAAFIVALVLVVLAAGGGAYALVSRSSGHLGAQPSSQPTLSSGARTTASSGPVSGPSAASASASASASRSSATPSPTQTGTVRVAPGVAGNSATPQVEAFLNRYFNSINTRNYSEWNSLLDAHGQQGDSQSTFESGYATTKDSNEIITGITDTGGGDVTANVSFTSRQSPADSIDHSACNDWQLSFFLEPQDGGYVATTPPSGYHAGYTDC